MSRPDVGKDGDAARGLDDASTGCSPGSVGGRDAARAPSLPRRMGSFVYEGLLLFGIGLIPGALGAVFVALTGHRHPLQSDAALRAFTLVLYAVYFTWFWSVRGQTLPMQTWHIRVVTALGQPLSQPRALCRFVAACAWFAPATGVAMLNGWTRWQGLGAVGVGVVAYALLSRLHPQRQFWHDALCGTRLVEAPKADRKARASRIPRADPAR